MFQFGFFFFFKVSQSMTCSGTKKGWNIFEFLWYSSVQQIMDVIVTIIVPNGSSLKKCHNQVFIKNCLEISFPCYYTAQEDIIYCKGEEPLTRWWCAAVTIIIGMEGSQEWWELKSRDNWIPEISPYWFLSREECLYKFPYVLVGMPVCSGKNFEHWQKSEASVYKSFG